MQEKETVPFTSGTKMGEIRKREVRKWSNVRKETRRDEAIEELRGNKNTDEAIKLYKYKVWNFE